MQSTKARIERAAESAIKPARVPHFLDAERLSTEHGPALRAMASILLADRAEAEGVVSRLLARAGGTLVTSTDRGTRRRLSRQLYLSCTWAKLVSGYFQDLPPWLEESGDGVAEAIDRLSDTSEQQRSAIALYLYGDHDCRQVAELLALPAAVVLELLRSGLHELHLDDGTALTG